MNWLSWLMPGRRQAARTGHERQADEPPLRIEPLGDAMPGTPERAPPSAQPSPAVPAPTLQAIPWLLGCNALTDSPITAIERDALEAVARALTQPVVADNLLPRAAALIPQLIALIRQSESLPTPAIVERVGKDTQLVAELMRLASSPYYRVQGEVTSLEQAINLIGVQGLQTVIARVVLKPIYGAAPGPLSGRAGLRLWEHSEALARHTAILADASGQPVLDAYLAGMLHDTGWTVAFSLIDRAGLSAPLALPPSQTFGTAVTEQAHRLFGLAAQAWDITPGFTALAQDARRNGLAAASHPLAQLLIQAQERCLRELGDDGKPA